ncbi:VOC family protein [Aquibium microcysteis]|uniref:VOC family protein n=1 Tax=Aquibium microcysteis TaxID=675281 RepID=UPI00165CF705|nr:VOC family protein [Aquibium microcysteis]
MSNTLPNAALDHLVLPTASLETARGRLGALGFTVAPTGVHPFGTANCCVYMADGTFLEPLAIADADACAAAAAAGNVFVGRDRAFRSTGRHEGFSAIVLASDDADADHGTFVGAGLSAGDVLSFSRPFQDASGRSDTASFKLAFAAAPRTLPFVFSCQRLNAPAVDRSALQHHANGVTRLLSIMVVAADPAAASRFFATVTGVAGEAGATATRYALANGDILVRPATSGDGALPTGLFDFRAVTFGVSDLSATRRVLSANGIAFETTDQRITVPPAPGQGAGFIFEERA